MLRTWRKASISPADACKYPGYHVPAGSMQRFGRALAFKPGFFLGSCVVS
jgi:hypothetical protein